MGVRYIGHVATLFGIFIEVWGIKTNTLELSLFLNIFVLMIHETFYYEKPIFRNLSPTFGRKIMIQCNMLNEITNRLSERDSVKAFDSQRPTMTIYL